ncbi:MAG: 6-O-methylguanine DNA methyltransferase, methylated-DNA-[protein]-cysteine S-methyltransferase [Parcubacteria group bacterium GW2011_GWC1_38_22]|nr:MAG: 6-O-methylguanine DNA methyltransferase, methylated-DNA-[protein]-cysteine S-methyltransferase [Parcubacteria group bacterium GW2011_GWC1_38_22]
MYLIVIVSNIFLSNVVLEMKGLINLIMRDYSKKGQSSATRRKRGLPAYRTPSSFPAKVFSEVRKIPRGKTLTYKEVAILIGKPNSYRAVGNALNKNCNGDVPCHRVIRSDGQIGGFNKGKFQKIKLLKQEGVI